MINLEFACYLVFVCVHWVLFFSCCLAQKEAKVRVCCAVSFILPPVQAILWWQLAEVPRDVGSQFNFHFIVSASGVDGGRGKMMLDLWQTVLYHFFRRSEACSTSSWSMGQGTWVTFQIPGSAWLAPVAPWQMWHEEHLGCAGAPATTWAHLQLQGGGSRPVTESSCLREEGSWRWRQDPVICQWGRCKIYLMLLQSESLLAGRKREGEGLYLVYPATGV